VRLSLLSQQLIGFYGDSFDWLLTQIGSTKSQAVVLQALVSLGYWC
jgi:hypothetical protein